MDDLKYGRLNKFNVSAIARAIGYRPVSLYLVVNGKQKMSRKMARSLEMVTNGELDSLDLLLKYGRGGKRIEEAEIFKWWQLVAKKIIGK